MLPALLLCAGLPLAGRPRPMAGALQPFVDRHIMAGAVVVVANRERILDVETVGFADVAARRPMAPDTLFYIASMSKPIAAAAAMMLVDEGRLRLDDPVEKYLPEFRGQMLRVETDDRHVLLRRPARPVLVRDLLSHTSGMPKHYPLEFMKNDALPLSDIVRTYPLYPLESEPGTRYDYSNAGINTVGRLVEVASGMPYEQFLASRIFRPLGMADTTFFPTAAQLGRLARNYRDRPDHAFVQDVPIAGLTYPLDSPRRHPMPAGGLFSTAGDLARFCRMMLAEGTWEGREYLKAETVAAMTRKQTPAAVAERYGFGWRTGWGLAGEAYGHDGALRTDMFIDPKAGFVAVFMVQHEGGWTGDEENRVWPAFIDASYRVAAAPPEPPKRQGFSTERLQRIRRRIEGRVAARSLAGAEALVSRDGRVAYFCASGMADVETGRPLARDGIVRFCSMTKPVVAAAVLMLVEEGKLRLTDPVADFIPAFHHLRVAVAGRTGAGLPATVPAARDITIRDLLTHTSGLGSGPISDAAIRRLGRRRGETLADFIPRLASTPLEFQPGSRWHYSGSAGFDTLGRIIEIASGETLDRFLARSLFLPLEMKDATFAPNPEQMKRLVTVYLARDGGLVRLPHQEDPIDRVYFSGSSGLVGTIDDYFHFAQMLCGGGRFRDVRLLSPRMVQLMGSEQIPDTMPGRSRGEAWGLGVRVIAGGAGDGTLLSSGSFGWSGSDGTHFWVDPRQ